MTRYLVGLLVLLAGCTLETKAPELTRTEVYRDTAAQIASQANVDAARMEGVWQVRQDFAGSGRTAQGLLIRPTETGNLEIWGTIGLCDPAACDTMAGPFVYIADGIGRWRGGPDQTLFADAEVWVMWMDFDGRTAAIGTPSGAFGLIIDKAATGGGDRIAAAGEIMAWFGYDMSRLRKTR